MNSLAAGAEILSGQAYWLPVLFIGLMGLAFLLYAILDGYDLGVGILLPFDQTELSGSEIDAATEKLRDRMIASIGPFWDANETWLVLAVGLLLIAFPSAHSLVLGHLYLPALVLLVGLMLRGVAFDFRAKAPLEHKLRWDWAFKGGSLLATLAQGYMLGRYVGGFESGWAAQAFALLSAVCVSAGYSFIGAAWLVMKTEGALQVRAVRWARITLWLMVLGIAAVSIVSPLLNPEVFAKWFRLPEVILLLMIPMVVTTLVVACDRYLARYPYRDDMGCWFPFAAAVGIFLFSFIGLGYSFFPYVVPGQLTVWQAASDISALRFMAYGAVTVVPIILIYTAYSYRVFWGKANDLTYQ